MKSKAILLLLLYLSQSIALELVISEDYGEKLTWSLGAGVYTVRMHEEMELGTILGNLTRQDPLAEIALNFILPNSNANDNLGLQIIQSGAEVNTFYLNITLRQNYESSYFVQPDKRYLFEIMVPDEELIRMQITLVNINDNPPVVEVNNASCAIEENNSDITNCSVTISDLDGHMEDFEKTLSNEMDAIFEFVGGVTDADVKEMTLLLKPKVELDYESIMLYVMDLTVTDTPIVNGDDVFSTTAKMVVEVIDLPDTDPVWVTIFASQQFLELEEQRFQVQARDGDIGVNDDITYSKDDRWNNYISIGEETGVIDVGQIYRDYDAIQIYEFRIFACEVQMPDACINQTITFLVEDINNQLPEITTNTTYIKIEENYYKDLPLSLSVNDLDIGDNALYSVALYSSGEQKTAFTIAPSTGYQETNLYLYVTNFYLLDYEEKEWRSFELTILTEDRTDPYNKHNVTIEFELINLNDEIPIFQNMETETGYVVEILETVGLGEEIKTVYAEDRDIGDKVSYGLLGTYINSILTIDEENGQITTIVARALDYETQEEVVLQVRAIDSLMEPFNTAIAQVTIVVGDVNDETPRIIVDNQRVEIEENIEQDFVVIVNSTSNYLIATDDDQTADLLFSIDWDSSYATKTGRRVDDVFEPYKGCITIETFPLDSSSSAKGKSAAAVLQINKIQDRQTPDFEMFEIIYLRIKVVDLNQTYGENTNSVTVPIYVIDIDDEPPVFVESTITSAKNVVEKSLVGTVIGIVIATDVDSEEIFYYISPQDSDYDGLVAINDLGEISVAAEIDADIPIYSMTFNVIASDEYRNTTAEITITVTDINDNPPIFVYPLSGAQFTVYEQIDDGEIIIEELIATDADRDAPNNVITYSLSSNQLFDTTLRSYFGVVNSSFRVSYADENNKLDRDGEMPGINNTIYLVARDQGDNPLSGEVSFYVILLDINNKDPELITEEIKDKDENLSKNELIGQIVAHDDDEAGTENTRINFELLSITAQSGKEIPPNIFYLDNPDPDAGTVDLKTAIDLKGYYGTYTLTIQTEDEGTIPGPRSSIGTVTVEINMYNFEDPFFNNLRDGDKLFLGTKQDIGARLVLYNGDALQDFSATDQQGNKYALSFTIISDESELFAIQYVTSTISQLQMTSNSLDTEQIYTITLQLEAVNASPTRTVQITITVQFVDQDAEPIFTETTQTIWFVENQTDHQSEIFHNAYFQNLPDELDFPVYYIMISNNPEFEIKNSRENEISLITALDREEQPSYEVRVASSRLGSGVAVPDPKSTLTLTIRLIDINDNPPNFVSRTFYGSISSTIAIGSSILQILATDLDEDPELIYSIEDYIIIPSSISSDHPFSIDSITGIISSSVTILDNAEGYFLFNVNVNDGEFSDSATVNIYIVSDKHRVEFRFANDVNDVDALQNQISSVLETQFNYTCIIEQVLQNTDTNGIPIEDDTIVRIYFVNSEINSPILKEDIEIVANNIQIFKSLATQFEQYQLILLGFSNNSSTSQDMEKVFRAWLIGVTVVMSTLCILLFVAFILKTRSLTQRLNKLSVIRYGSQESVNNRRAAPFTNKHATEGSNPAYSEDKIKSPGSEDAISIGSGDSDLIGVENNPEFDYKYEKQENSTK